MLYSFYVEKSSINNASFFLIEMHQGFFEKIQGTLYTRTQNDQTVFWRAQNIQFSSHKAACPTLHLIEQCVPLQKRAWFRLCGTKYV